MRKILSVIKREYLQIVRTKGFIIGTILGPVLMAAFIVVPIVVSLVSVDKQEVVGVVDLSGVVLTEMEKKLDMKLKDDQKRYIFREFRPAADLDAMRDELNKLILTKEITSYLIIPEGIADGGEAEYYSEHVSDFDKIRSIGETINSIVIEKRLRQEGLEPDKIAEYMQRVTLKTHKVTKRGVEEDTGGTFLISYFLVLILYMTLFFYGSIILRGVIEEKSNRVVEVVLSSLKPFQLMMGKILGIAAVGFTQYAIWALFGLALTKFSGPIASGLMPAAEAFKIPTIPVYVFIYFVLFFILGYFLYGTLYAAVGSMVNNEKEAQQMIFPISMFLIVPILLMTLVIRAPNSSLAVVLSLIPFFSPILMLLRICILVPPFPQIVASILLMIGAILLMIWLTAKIYRVGILMYGKRPNFGEILKWIRFS
jgi:ABC-2 type transport system permease protein